MNLDINKAWRTFEKTAAAAVNDVAAERARGITMATAFRADGALRITPTRALKETSDLAIAVFYRELAGDGRLSSVCDPGWMLDSDFAFVNVRACGPHPDRTGRIPDALKVIPTMRVTAIHLAPFFDNTLHNLYAVDSLHVVSDAVTDPALKAAGLDGDVQLRLLVDAIHILGWRVGFDLEPHTSTFSRIALSNPNCFRWLRVAADRKSLHGGITQEKMLDPHVQARLVEEVHTIVSRTERQYGLSAVEDTSKGLDALRACHAAITQALVAEGYWTLPSQTWSGVGLPRFDHYDTEGNYPEYEYMNAEGEDQQEHAFGMLSPFKLFEPLPVNAFPSDDALPQPVPASIDLLNSIFPSVQARYGFDFVRLDYVDHVFDSIRATTPVLATGDRRGWDVPISDRLTPKLLEDLIATARHANPATGAMAERMGVDVEDYGSLGFNLLLGTDVLSTMHADYIRFILSLQRELDDESEENPRVLTRQSTAPVEQKRHPCCSVLAALDTHDSGHPLFWTVPLSEAVGAEGLHLRHFVARFATCGKRRRPKYEVMGNQDLSHGLYEANNHPTSIHWKGDEAFNRRYHSLEDVYVQWRPFLRNARIGPSTVDGTEGRWASWFIDGADVRLLCVIALEPEIGKVGRWIENPPRLSRTGEVTVDVVTGTPWGEATVHAIPIDGKRSTRVKMRGTQLLVGRIPPQGCRLYRVCRSD